MNAELLAALAGIALSLIFSYIPGASTKFANLAKETKQLIMLGVITLTAAAVFGLSCTTWAAGWGINVSCDQAGLQELIKVWLATLVANQGVYLVTPASKSVRAVKVAKASRPDNV